MGVMIIEGERAVLGLNFGRPIVTNGDFVMRLFPNYFGQYLFIMLPFSAGLLCYIGIVIV